MEDEMLYKAFSGRSSLVRCNLFIFFCVINFVVIVDFLETIGDECLSIFDDISSMCCGVIGIVGVVSAAVVVLYFRKKSFHNIRVNGRR